MRLKCCHWTAAIILSLVLAASVPSLGYGVAGHQAIITGALGLVSPGVRERVLRTLGSLDPQTAAIWPDQVREARKHQGPLAGDSHAAEFNRSFPHHDSWHFVNLPLGSETYLDNPEFTESGADAAHAIQQFIAVLETPEGQTPPLMLRDEGRALTKQEALCYLIHSVGDIHQPLHAGCGYFVRDADHAQLVIDPRQAADSTLMSDRGGNQLLYSASQNLHHMWDDPLVYRAAGLKEKAPSSDVAQALSQNLTLDDFRTSGDYHRWSFAWAMDSVHQARLAYDNLTFHGVRQDAKGQEVIDIDLPANYKTVQAPRAALQLRKAMVHLAQLLEAIQWK